VGGTILARGADELKLEELRDARVDLSAVFLYKDLRARAWGRCNGACRVVCGGTSSRRT